MIPINLSEEEKRILKNYSKTTSLILVRLKSQAILMKNRGISFVDIADVLDRHERSIRRWVQDFKDRRLSSIFTGQANNQNAAKLTREQKMEIKKVLSSPPKPVGGLPKEFWDIPTLKKYVKAQFKVVYESKRSYHYLLRFSNLSFKESDVFDVKRDEEAVRQRMIKIRKEIMPKIKDDNWIVLASDETRVMLEALTRRAWLKKGEKTILKVTKSNESQYYIGFLNIKNGKCHLKALKWGNQKEVIKALMWVTHNLYPGKKVCIIWDNVSFHKGKDLTCLLGKDNPLEKIYLINFPPYAPDTNPQEQVWNMGKKHISNHQFQSFSSTKRSFSRFINNRLFDYTI